MGCRSRERKPKRGFDSDKVWLKFGIMGFLDVIEQDQSFKHILYTLWFWKNFKDFF
jgi:hypothetical protein